MDLQTVVVKEWGTEDVEYFSKSSPKVSAPQEFVICRTAMPLIITTFGFVGAVIC